MKISLTLFIYLLTGINCLENGDLMKYLDDRAKIVGEKLIRHAREQENLYTVKFNNTNIKLIGNYTHGEIFTFFNTPYALLDQNLVKISQINSTVIHVLPKSDIVFVKIKQFKSLGFIAFATTPKNVLHIYGLHKQTQKFFKIQNLIKLNLTDAEFFENQDNLYLVVSSYKTHDLTSVVVYKFVETHFDEIENFLTSSATKIYTFPDEKNEIILILNEKNPNLYEFDDNKVKNIQKIDAKAPKDTASYLNQGKRYVVIFGAKNSVELYLWTGFDLLHLEQFTINEIATHKKFVFYVDKSPFLFTKNNESFLIFSLQNNNFNLIYESKFDTNYTKTWDYNLLRDKNTLITLGPAVDNSTEIQNISIFLKRNIFEESIVEDNENSLTNCFLNLEKAVYFLRNKLTTTQNQNQDFLRESNSGLPSQKFKKLLKKYDSVKNRKSKSLIIDEPATLKIPLKTKKIVAKEIKFENLKNEIWQPEKWLSYSKPQNVSGFVKAELIQVQNLETNQSLFNNLLLSTGNQNLSGSVIVNNLETRELETNLLNNIPLKNFYFRSQPEKIKGTKNFPQMSVRNIQTASINGMDAKTVVTNLQSQYNFAPNLTINNLFVENINEINFEQFKNSVFRLGVTNTIHGNLTFANLEATEMNFDTISKKSEFLTYSTNQTINSTITISHIYAHDIKTNKINGVEPKNFAKLDGDTITGPVSIKDLNVRNNLELDGEIKNELLLLNDTHIVGTNVSDFLQIYTGNVKIKGNLFLKHFNLGKSAKINISESEFNPDFDRFWRKSTQQEIPNHFQAQNGVSTSHVTTVFVNNVEVNDYMLNSTQQKKPTKFYFENVTIKGNVLLNPEEEHSPDLQRIQKESVRINGTFNIRGRKTYKNVLKVEELELNQLNDDVVDDSSDNPEKIKNIVVRGDLRAGNLTLGEINNVNLTDLIKNTVFINQSQNVTKLNFDNITVQNLLVTSKLNNQDIEKVISKLQKINNTVKVNVIVNNNVTIRNCRNLSKINSFDVEELMLKSLSKYDNGTIFGNVKFLGNVKIRDLHVIVINDFNFQKLTRTVFYKSWKQTIKEHFTFNKLISDNLVTDQINDFLVKNLIDVSSNKSQVIFAPNGLKFKKNVKIQNLVANIGCDVSESLRNLRNPPSQLWDNVIVTGNATFWDKESLISRIFENVVTNYSESHTIRGNVNFVNHISANNMDALNINNVNISEIIQDAFLNKPNLEQVITGSKRFLKLEAEDVVCLQNLNVSEVNGLNISEIDKKIISKNSLLDVPIEGKKVFFGGLQAKKIETRFVSGVEASNLVSSGNLKKIPNAIFESVSVANNFNVKFINNMPLDVVLKERFLKSGPKQILTGNYFLQNVKFNGNISTPQINDVKLENVVYDDKIQVIKSPKKFSNDFKIIGDMKVELINGFEVSKLYEQAVLHDEDTNFKKTVHIFKPTVMDGNIQTNYINNISVNYMLDTINKNSLSSETDQIHNITGIITNIIRKYFNTTTRMPSEFLYLEKTLDLEIQSTNIVGAEVVETKDDILIHLESEEDGYSCGLPPTCKCPLQQTMQVSSEHSVNMFLNKATQRIYSHYDESIIVHFITHSISTDSYCRSSKNKIIEEVSSLSWTVTPRGNNTGGFFMHRGFFTGYITGVKFFTIEGKTYIVVGVYYDPVLDSHKVNSLVLRFNQDQTKIEEIQKIPTVGLKTIALFPTAQGFVLITGNDVSNQHNGTNTKIFRFNQEKEQFEILRDVPTFGCLFAQGVVLERDSLIILANERSVLHILKYHAEFDNYYFYQSFQLDYPVSSLTVYYAEDFGVSDAYLSVVTKNSKYFIFSFQFIEGWKIEAIGELDGMKILVPFKVNKKSLLLAPSSKTSTLLSIVEHDSD